jgi:hypothetical protein
MIENIILEAVKDLAKAGFIHGCLGQNDAQYVLGQAKAWEIVSKNGDLQLDYRNLFNSHYANLRQYCGWEPKDIKQLRVTLNDV